MGWAAKTFSRAQQSSAVPGAAANRPSMPRTPASRERAARAKPVRSSAPSRSSTPISTKEPQEAAVQTKGVAMGSGTGLAPLAMCRHSTAPLAWYRHCAIVDPLPPPGTGCDTAPGPPHLCSCGANAAPDRSRGPRSGQQIVAPHPRGTVRGAVPSVRPGPAAPSALGQAADFPRVEAGELRDAGRGDTGGQRAVDE
ncbi:hypothetical protein SALBM135S_04255 [Streptomyces alboniger]